MRFWSAALAVGFGMGAAASPAVDGIDWETMLDGHAGEPDHRDDMADANIGRECGDLLWALRNVDLEYRYWVDAELRDGTLYPLLTRAVNAFYRVRLVE